MPSFKVSGLDEQIAMFEKLNAKTIPNVKAALYEGAGIVADEMRKSLRDALSTLPENERRRTGDLERSMYIAEMSVDKNGTVSTVVNFAGYNSEGRPNPLIANVLESGRSDQNRRKTGFARKARRAAKKPCEAAMAKAFARQIDKLTKEFK